MTCLRVALCVAVVAGGPLTAYACAPGDAYRGLAIGGVDAAHTDSGISARDATTEDQRSSQRPFCSTMDASLCWSFDEERAGSSIIRGPLDPYPPKGLGEQSLSPQFFSPPNALRLAVMPTATEGAQIGLRHRFPIAFTKVTCDFELAVELAGTKSAIVFNVVSEAATAEFAALYLTSTGTTATPAVEMHAARVVGTPEGDAVVGEIPVGEWAHVHFAIAPGGDGARITASVRDAKPVVLNTPAFALLRYADLFLSAAVAASDWIARYDNLSCMYE